MRFEGRVLALAFALTAGLGGFAPGTARAQQDVQVAATAFAEGQQAQLRGDFVRAAEFFEIADLSAPSPAALRSAIRNRDAAGQSARAATLALQAIERYPDDRETRATADGVLVRLSPKLGRVRIRCSEPCTATVDGGVLTNEVTSSVDFFVTPDRHTLRVAWPGREPAVQTVDVAAGQSVDLAFEAPPPTAPSAPATPPPAAQVPPGSEQPAASHTPAARVETAPPSSGLSPAVFWVGVGLTAIAAGAAAWSGFDTLSARDDYENSPTRDGYEDGLELERRTNVLIGTSALFGIATLGIGLFATDWKGSSSVELEAGPSSARLSFRGSLP